MKKKSIVKEVISQQKQAIKRNQRKWYNLRPLLGCANWAMFFFLLGCRGGGKSYSVMNFFVDQFVNRGIPFIWLRLTDAQAQCLLKNDAYDLVDKDIVKKYKLDLVTNGNCVYHVTKRGQPDKLGKRPILEKKLMARVYAVSTFYKNKGSLFDKDFLKNKDMRYNIGIDEFERESGERNTFDMVYALVNQLVNLVRDTKDRIKVFFLGNTLEDSSDILCAFNFIPEKFGIFKLKKKRCVIENIEPTDADRERFQGSIADILYPTASTFTNKNETDNTLITKKRLLEPQYVIKFTKNKKDWFTVWDGNIIKKYTNENKPVIPMRPYLDEVYNVNAVRSMIELFDTRSMMFTNLITFKQYQKQMELLRPKH